MRSSLAAGVSPTATWSREPAVSNCPPRPPSTRPHACSAPACLPPRACTTPSGPQASGLVWPAGPSPPSGPVGSPRRAPSLRLRPLVSALPAGDGWRWRRLCVSGENGSGSHPPSRLRSSNCGGLRSGLRHQSADTDPRRRRRRRRRCCHRRRRPSPGPRQSMEKWRLPLSREFGSVGARPGALGPELCGRLSRAPDLLTSCSAPGYATLRWLRVGAMLFTTGKPVLPSSGSLCRPREGPGPYVTDGLPFKGPLSTLQSDSSLFPCAATATLLQEPQAANW